MFYSSKFRFLESYSSKFRKLKILESLNPQKEEQKLKSSDTRSQKSKTQALEKTKENNKSKSENKLNLFMLIYSITNIDFVFIFPKDVQIAELF